MTVGTWIEKLIVETDLTIEIAMIAAAIVVAAVGLAAFVLPTVAIPEYSDLWLVRSPALEAKRNIKRLVCCFLSIFISVDLIYLRLEYFLSVFFFNSLFWFNKI